MANYKKVFVKGCLFYPKREQDVFLLENKELILQKIKKHFEKKIAF